jgi:hypothetical protein
MPPHFLVTWSVEIERPHERGARVDRLAGLLREVGHKPLAQFREATECGQDAIVAVALGDVPRGAISRRDAVVVEFRVLLHNRNERSRRGRPQVQFAVRNVTGESTQVPAPIEDAAGCRRKAREQRPTECLPGGVLVARPVGPVGLASGEPGPAESDRSLARINSTVSA